MKQYQLFISGQVLNGFDQTTAVRSLARVFNCSEKAAQALLSGKTTPIKRLMSLEEVELRQKSLQMIGVACFAKNLAKEKSFGASEMSLVDDAQPIVEPQAIEKSNDIVCPKCGEGGQSGTECRNCGIIFSRYRPPSQNTSPRNPEHVDAQDDGEFESQDLHPAVELLRKLASSIRVSHVAVALLAAGIFYFFFGSGGRELYVDAAYMSEGFSIATSVKADVSNYYFDTGKLPSSNSDLSLPSPENYAINKVRSVEVLPGGAIKVAFRELFDTSSGVMILEPDISRPHLGVIWSCRFEGFPDLSKYYPQCTDQKVAADAPIEPPKFRMDTGVDCVALVEEYANFMESMGVPAISYTEYLTHDDATRLRVENSEYYIKTVNCAGALESYPIGHQWPELYRTIMDLERWYESTFALLESKKTENPGFSLDMTKLINASNDAVIVLRKVNG